MGQTAFYDLDYAEVFTLLCNAYIERVTLLRFWLWFNGLFYGLTW